MRKDWYDLSWLPPPSHRDAFRSHCETLVLNPSLEAFVTLANQKLAENQLRKLSEACERLKTMPSGFEQFNLTVLSDANCEFLGPALKASALRYGVWLEIHVESLGHTVAAALHQHSSMYQRRNDGVLV